MTYAAARYDGMRMHVSPKSNRREKRAIDLHLCKLRHLVEDAFERIKRWWLGHVLSQDTDIFCRDRPDRFTSLWLHI